MTTKPQEIFVGANQVRRSSPRHDLENEGKCSQAANPGGYNLFVAAWALAFGRSRSQ